MSLKKVISGISVALSIGVTSPALALEIGYCNTPQGLSAKLKTEGHRTVATMERVGVSLELNKATGKNLVARAANLVTATPDMKNWYIVRAFAPLGERSDKMCISSAGNNLEINDYRKDKKPTVTNYNFDKAKALAACKKLGDKVSHCSDHAEFVEQLQRRLHERIALQGVSRDKKDLVTIVADPGISPEDLGEKDFRILSTTMTGATAVSLSGYKFGFSKWVLGVLDKQ